MNFEKSRYRISPSMEAILWWTLFFVALLPVLNTPFLPSVDGPSHLYNARIIADLSWGKEITAYFYELNLLTPNLLGHFILASGQAIFPAWLAEKILLLGTAFLLCFSFRRLIIRTGGDLSLSYLIFPFIITFPVLLGFYNFNLGLALLFCILLQWFRISGYPSPQPGSYIGLSILLTLAYLAHPVGIGGALLVIGLKAVWEKSRRNIPWREWSVRHILLVATLLPTLLLWILLPKGESGMAFNTGELLFTKPALLWRDWYSARPLSGFNNEIEILYSRSFFIVLSALTVLLIFKWRKTSSNENGRFFIIPALCFLLLYMFMPDNNGKFGYLSMRLHILHLLFWILALSSFITKRWLSASIIITSAFITTGRTVFYTLELSEKYNNAREVANAGKLLPAGARVLCIDRSGHWFYRHFADYAGLEEPVVLSENYEAVYGYFPVRFASNAPALILPGIPSGCSYAFPPSADTAEGLEYTHVLITGTEDGNKQCSSELDHYLLRTEKIYERNFTSLYYVKSL